MAEDVAEPGGVEAREGVAGVLRGESGHGVERVVEAAVAGVEEGHMHSGQHRLLRRCVGGALGPRF